jgi:hypothetical protein
MYFGRPDRPFHTSFARLAILTECGCNKTRKEVPRNQRSHRGGQQEAAAFDEANQDRGSPVLLQAMSGKFNASVWL